MKLLGRSFMVSAFLMISDFVSFIISLYLALGIFHANVDNFVVASSLQETGGWVALHWLLGLFCIGWFAVRLRHYFYRKTFWFELKEILRTLIIIAFIEMAVIAFATWSFLTIFMVFNMVSSTYTRSTFTNVGKTFIKYL